MAAKYVNSWGYCSSNKKKMIEFGDGSVGEIRNTVDHAKEFAKGAAEMSLKLAKGCGDIVWQTLGNENSFLPKYFGRDSYVMGRLQGLCVRTFTRLEL